MEDIIDNDHLKVEGNWKKLWKSCVPTKVKLFLWRLLRGCLPVRSRLVQKGIQCNNKCPHCDSFEENELHCFFGCVSTQEVWKETEDWNYIDNYMTNAAGCVDMLFKIINDLELKTVSRITMVLWTIWWRRNQKCWNDQVPNVFYVLRRARDALQDWIQMQAQRNSMQRDTAITTNAMWTKPATGMLKCNIDSSCYAEQNTYCVGACIRDSGGRFVQAFMKKSAGKPLIAEAEAKGLLDVLQWLQGSDRLTGPIIIETDCLQVVQAIRSRQKNNTEFGTIIDCCRRILNLYENCSLTYVRRQANRVAHDLAQASRFIAYLQVLNSCPSCIETTIMNEMN